MKMMEIEKEELLDGVESMIAKNEVLEHSVKALNVCV